ncbi:MAG: hypothetical protein U9N13_05470 [Euryarchaeota archaeon]|nr:hypothetical protein [Euryarchaeota archaeon]
MKFGLTRWGPRRVSKWDPFEEIRHAQEHLNQLFREITPREEWFTGDVLTPPVDVKEKDDN